MAKIHNLGFPRIGEKRQLKHALEKYWRGKIDSTELNDTAQSLRHRNLSIAQGLDLVPVGDFSFYDQVLDTSFLLGNVPQRAQQQGGDFLDAYFRAARGRSPADTDCCGVAAGEMTKWFDTNYHYIVPEFDDKTSFELNAGRLLAQVSEAQALGHQVKPVIIGPVTYLWLGKEKDQSNRLDLLDSLLPIYSELFDLLAEQGIEWIQVDEPALVTELDSQWQQAFLTSYRHLAASKVKLLLTSYFGQLKDNLNLVVQLPVDGVHIDATRAREEVVLLQASLNSNVVLSVGIIDGRNVWKTDLNAALAFLEPISQALGERLWLAPSCSLLHVPVDLALEDKMDVQIRQWLAFAVQKLDELKTLGVALNHGRDQVGETLAQNALCVVSRQQSELVHNLAVKAAVNAIKPKSRFRNSVYETRAKLHQQILKLPKFPTTTIGSFPQTSEIRAARKNFRVGNIDEQQYVELMQIQIADCIQRQEALGLDVLVHGEAERNDMVEYFGEQLSGFIFSSKGWVQSYGSRCVKPPIIYGDVSRDNPMTVKWTRYAQSLTDKPVKGMLTGPVTILNWSFVRDDQPRSQTCEQIALAIREEVIELEKAGVNVIQIDEAALREGLPLRKAQWQEYLKWSVNAFKLCANGVSDQTQIHTHMCYSQFNDIIHAIADMDADVITIETSRSDMKLLDAFEQFSYPNEIGPGVYDIHSPNIPEVASIVKLMRLAAQKVPAERLWVNPDCGLKTRTWDEVIPALKNMIKASQTLRNSLQ